jgi:hypothetical protein
MMEDLMEDFAQLMQRLLEIQSGGRQRSPELVAEDERLMEDLQKRISVTEPSQTGKLGQSSLEWVESLTVFLRDFTLPVSPSREYGA